MPAERPTLRTLAAEAGVSPTTVSLALRNNPGVSIATRVRIKKLADDRGYRPDPAVTKLMHHLRSRQPTRFQASICGLTERWPAGNEMRHIYSDRLLAGLRERAAALGYAFSVIQLDEAGPGPRLQQTLARRGIECLVVLPLLQPRDLSSLLDWRLFFTVSVTSSILAPRFHTIIPQHFDNMLLACRQLTLAGYRRIGLALPKDWDLRVNHRWTGAMTWHNVYGGTSAVRPYIGEAHGPAVDPVSFKAWLLAQKPDVVICDDIGMAVIQETIQTLSAARRPRIVTLNWSTIRGDSGIDQRVELIGATAIDILASMYVHSERGIPAAPYATMMPGRWIDLVSPLPRKATGRGTSRPSSRRRAR